jgi:hypothetical protein
LYCNAGAGVATEPTPTAADPTANTTAATEPVTVREAAGAKQPASQSTQSTAVLDLGEIMICGLDFPKYFLINSLITRSNF